MPPFVLYQRVKALRPLVLAQLLELAETGQQELVKAAILMLADFFTHGIESRYAKKLQGTPIWELKTQSRGGQKGGVRIYFYFRQNGDAVIVNMEVKDGDSPGPALREATLAALADEQRS